MTMLAGHCQAAVQLARPKGATGITHHQHPHPKSVPPPPPPAHAPTCMQLRRTAGSTCVAAPFASAVMMLSRT